MAFPKMRHVPEASVGYVGVDPGMGGGLCFQRENIVEVVPMPQTELDLWDWFDNIRQLNANVFACVERVGGHIAGRNQPGSAMFKFGQNYGSLRMCLVAAGIPFEDVTPQQWQRGMGVPPRTKDGGVKESDSSFKNRLKSRAQSLFPDVKVTLKTCDALLLSEYVKRKRTGTL